MTEPPTERPRPSANPRTAQPAESVDVVDRDAYTGTDIDPSESPPGTPRWVKTLGILLLVLLLAFAGLHLTGNAPEHMPGAAEHGMQSP